MSIAKQELNCNWEDNLHNLPSFLVHYSSTPDLKTIDPSKMGEGMDARTKGRLMSDDCKFSFYYRPDGPVEDHVLNSKSCKHIVAIPYNCRLYDVSEDKDGFMGILKAKKTVVAGEDLFKAVKDAGYDGFYASYHPYDAMRNTVMMFKPLEVIHSSEISIEDRIKSENSSTYKEKMSAR